MDDYNLQITYFIFCFNSNLQIIILIHISFTGLSEG